MAVTTSPGKGKPKRRVQTKEPAEVTGLTEAGTDRALVPAQTTSPIIIPDQAAGDALLREFGMEDHPKGGFHGLLEVIPTRADWLLDLIRANSLWPLLSCQS
jgi:hypothetical protein